MTTRQRAARPYLTAAFVLLIFFSALLSVVLHSSFFALFCAYCGFHIGDMWGTWKENHDHG